MFNELITLMNQPLIIIIVIAIPIVIIFKHFFKEKLLRFKAKNKSENEKEINLKSITGKIAFAIQNTEVAYQEISKHIKEADKQLHTLKSDDERKIWEKKKKSAEQQLKIVQKILENKDIIDMFEPILIPAMDKVEKKVMGVIKSGLKFS